jgi:hypothetical protein
MVSIYESAIGAASVVVIKAARMMDKSMLDRHQRTMELTGIAELDKLYTALSLWYKENSVCCGIPRVKRVHTRLLRLRGHKYCARKEEIGWI